MKSKLVSRGVVAILLFMAFSCTQEINLSEKTIVLQPDAAKGKDANIHSLESATSGDYESLIASAWTWASQSGAMRILIEFNLDTIPSNAIIEEARLSLYAATNLGEQHSAGDGSNAALIQRITSDWDESTVSWSTQPSTSESYQVTMAASSSADEDYVDLDIRTLIQYMVMNPESSYGLMIRLEEELPYRRLSFASSDNADATKHPKLVVKYLY